MSDPVSALRAVSGNDPASGATGLPNIPSVPMGTDPAMTNILSVMKSWMELAAGNGLTGFASKQELIDAGVLKSDESGKVIGQIDLTIPPVPTGLLANGAMTNILVQWDTPVGKYRNHAYTEVWASGVDDFSQAVMIGQAGGFVFSHSVGEDSTRYYWIRFVSTFGVKGPFNGVGGTQGMTAKNVNYLITSLTEAYGTNSAAPFFQIDQPTVINGVTIPAGTYMKSAFIAEGMITTAMIQNATIDAARITGKLTANQINADQLNVTNGTFSGQLIGASGTFSGALQAASGTFLGELQAATGSFAGSLMAGVLDFSALAGHTENRSSPGVYYFTLAADESRIRYQIMAGGGGGAMGHGGEWNEAAGGGGGGGAGEYRTGTIELSPGTQIRVIVGSGGAGGTTPYNVGYYDNWPANGSAGTYSSVGYWNGSSWVTLVSANPGQGGSAAPFNHWGGGGQNGWFTAGSGGSGYPSGASAVGGNAENGASAAGGAGASTVWGRGGSPGYPNAGWGSAGTGFGSGGGGAAGTHEWSGDSAWNRGSSGGGGSGMGGKAIIEFFNPNTVVLRSEFITLSQRVTAIENRLVTAGIP